MNAIWGIGVLPTILDKNPAGTYSFVGSVPAELSKKRADGQPMTDEEYRNIAQFGAGLYGKKYQTVTFQTEDEAVKAIEALGYTEDLEYPKPGVCGRRFVKVAGF